MPRARVTNIEDGKAQGILPALQDHAIADLEAAAVEYASIRDRRIALNQEESELKARVKAIMHRHNKTHYKHAEVEVTLEPPDGDERVTVRVKKQKEDDAPKTE